MEKTREEICKDHGYKRERAQSDEVCAFCGGPIFAGESMLIGHDGDWPVCGNICGFDNIKGADYCEHCGASHSGRIDSDCQVIHGR